MDRLSRLPVECLQHIIHFLSLDNKNSKRSLHALICTNKHFALIALPYLYSHPYQYTTHNRTYPNGNGIEPSSVRLTRMLLLRLLTTKSGGAQDWEPSAVVQVAYKLGDTTKETRPITTNTITNDTKINTTDFALDYLTHLHHLDVEWTVAGNYHNPPHIKIEGDLSQFVRGDDEYEKSISLDQFLEAWVYSNSLHDIRVWCLWPILRREVTWAIAGPILEQLRSLAIPVSDIRRYLVSIARFRNLEEVRFSLDEPFDYGEEYNSELTAEFVKTTQQRKAEALAAIVEFVKSHVRLFPARLQFVTCTNGVVYNFEPQECPKETLVEISRLLPILSRPLYLDEYNWPRFVVGILRIDLSAVEKVVFPDNTQSWWYETVCENREFLRRCRRLRILEMITLGPGVFRWAVQEKRDIGRLDRNIVPDVIDASPPYTTNDFLSQKQDNERQVEHDLVPIRSVTLSEHTIPFADEINDIAFGFSQTLEHFTIQASTLIGPPSHLNRVIHVGQGWINLPVLSELYLDIADANLVLDRQIWVHCPSLVHLTVIDPMTRYRCQDIIPCLPGHHVNLEVLSLQGSSALTFDAATLDSTLKLTSLSIFSGEPDAMHFFIPPVQELERSYGMQSEYDQEDDEEGTGIDFSQTGSDGTTNIIIRPRWTWNWNLPMLAYAMITGEFAYRFQFKMLQGCPLLETLRLDMTSMDGPYTHTRVLSKADLFVPSLLSVSSLSTSSSLSVSGNSIQHGERIVSPRLDFLSLRGHWVIDDTLLGEFLAGMFPNLRTFTEKTFGGFSFVGLLKAMREFSPDEGCGIAGEKGVEGGGGKGGGEIMALSNLSVVKTYTPFNFDDVELMDELGVYQRWDYRRQERLKTMVCLKPRIVFEGDLVGARNYVYGEFGCVILREPIR